MFQSVNPKEDFVALEHRILEFWERERIFEKLRAQLAGKPVWSFIDGPITANNPMGVHHAWGRTYKDVFQRYHAMKGFDQRWQNGFDCQGLWLEVETERDLGMNGKRDIEKMGLDAFSRACRARVDKYSGVQTKQSIRLGQWMRWDDSYYTMTDLNIEYIWHFLQICHEKKWLYLGHRSMPWCTRCGTSLSQHELADGYEDTIDESVYLRFPLKGRDGESLLVWTTTPWTLSSNVAAAVNPELDYARVRYHDHVYYVSTGVLEKIFKKDGEVLGTLKGAEMLGWTYDGPFDEFEIVKPVEHRVISWSDVSDAEGTGIVHIAPGCGAEDFELSKVHNLAVLAPLDGDGVYRAGFGWQSGRDVHEVEKPVLHDLKEKGVFFRQESYKHRYPFCWRRKHKLVFRIEDEWFIACDEIRLQMKARPRR
ncbi:MAG: class I tRNA ligase family protein [Candidatus Eisenbacteria bacterium]